MRSARTGKDFYLDFSAAIVIRIKIAGMAKTIANGMKPINIIAIGANANITKNVNRMLMMILEMM